MPASRRGGHFALPLQAAAAPRDLRDRFDERPPSAGGRSSYSDAPPLLSRLNTQQQQQEHYRSCSSSRPGSAAGNHIVWPISGSNSPADAEGSFDNKIAKPPLGARIAPDSSDAWPARGQQAAWKPSARSSSTAAVASAYDSRHSTTNVPAGFSGTNLAAQQAQQPSAQPQRSASSEERRGRLRVSDEGDVWLSPPAKAPSSHLIDAAEMPDTMQQSSFNLRVDPSLSAPAVARSRVQSANGSAAGSEPAPTTGNARAPAAASIADQPSSNAQPSSSISRSLANSDSGGYSPIPPFLRGPSDSHPSMKPWPGSGSAKPQAPRDSRLPPKARQPYHTNISQTFNGSRAPSQPPSIASTSGGRADKLSAPAPWAASSAMQGASFKEQAHGQPIEESSARTSAGKPHNRMASGSFNPSSSRSRPSSPRREESRPAAGPMYRIDQWPAHKEPAVRREGDTYRTYERSARQPDRRPVKRDDEDHDRWSYQRRRPEPKPVEGRRQSPPRPLGSSQDRRDSHRPMKREPESSPPPRPLAKAPSPPVRSYTPPPRSSANSSPVRPVGAQVKSEPQSPPPATAHAAPFAPVRTEPSSKPAHTQRNALPSDPGSSVQSKPSTSAQMAPPASRAKIEPPSPDVSKTSNPRLFQSPTKSPEDVKPAITQRFVPQPPPGPTIVPIASTAPPAQAALLSAEAQAAVPSRTTYQNKESTEIAPKRPGAPQRQVSATQLPNFTKHARLPDPQTASLAAQNPSKQQNASSTASHPVLQEKETIVAQDSDSDMEIDELEETEGSQRLSQPAAPVSATEPVTVSLRAASLEDPQAGTTSTKSAPPAPQAQSKPSSTQKNAAIVLSSDDEGSSSGSLEESLPAANGPHMYGMEVDQPTVSGSLQNRLAAHFRTARPPLPPIQPIASTSRSGLNSNTAEDSPVLTPRPEGEELSRVFPLSERVITARERGPKALRAAMRSFVDEKYESLELLYGAPLKQIDEIERNDSLRLCYSVLQLLSNELALPFPADCLRSAKKKADERDGAKRAFVTQEIARLAIEGRARELETTRFTPAFLIVIFKTPLAANASKESLELADKPVNYATVSKSGAESSNAASQHASRESTAETLKKRKRPLPDELSLMDDGASVSSAGSISSLSKKGKKKEKKEKKAKQDKQKEMQQQKVIPPVPKPLLPKDALSKQGSEALPPISPPTALPFKKSHNNSVEHLMHGSKLPKPSNTLEKARVMIYSESMRGYCAWSMRGHGIFWVPKGNGMKTVSHDARQDPNLLLQSALWFDEHQLAVLGYAGTSANAASLHVVKLYGTGNGVTRDRTKRSYHTLVQGDDLSGHTSLTSYQDSKGGLYVAGAGQNDRKIHMWSLDPLANNKTGSLAKIWSNRTDHSAAIRAMVWQSNRSKFYTAGADKRVCWVDPATNQCAEIWRENMGVNRMYLREDGRSLILCLAGARDQFRCVDLRVKNKNASAGLTFGQPTEKNDSLGQFSHGDVMGDLFSYPIDNKLHIWDLRNPSQATFAASGASGIIQPIFDTDRKVALLEKQHFTMMHLQ